MIGKILNGALPEVNEISWICEHVKDILKCEDNVVRIKGPVNVCGDLRGNFKDLLEVFRVGGEPGEINFVFLGNYIGYGGNSINILCLLFLYKIKYQNKVCLLRGNYETREMSAGKKLADECEKKFNGETTWYSLVDVFKYLPLACMIEDIIFCVHSGLSKNINTIDDINRINRFTEFSRRFPPEEPMCELLMTIPKSFTTEWYDDPATLKPSFGERITENFTTTNRIELIVRSNEFFSKGYDIKHNGKIATIFSTSNLFGDKLTYAAILQVDENLERNFIQYYVCGNL